MANVGVVVKICGMGVLCAVLVTLLGKLSVGGSAVRVGGGVLIFGAFILLIGEAADVMREHLFIPEGNEYLGEAFEVLMRSLGIGVLCKLCSDVCRDCGESAIANGIESAGRVGIFLLTLPIFSDILNFAREVLTMDV